MSSFALSDACQSEATITVHGHDINITGKSMAPLRLCVSWTEKGWVMMGMAGELLTRSYQDKGVEKSMAGSHHGKHGVSMGFKRGLNQGNQGRHNVVNRRNPQSHYLETSNLSKNSLLGLLGCLCMWCVQLSHTVGFPWISKKQIQEERQCKALQGNLFALRFS
jgi:hypothetical protein